MAATRWALRAWELDSRGPLRLPDVARDVLRHAEDSAETASLLEYWAYINFFHDDRLAGGAAADEAIRMSSRLGLQYPVGALCLRGVGRCEGGDRSGLKDLEAALEEAQRRGAELLAAQAAINLASQKCAWDGPAGATGLLRRMLERAEQRHDRSTMASLGTTLAFCLWWSGGWDEADHLIGMLMPVLEERRHELLIDIRLLAALSSLLRGRLEEAEAHALACESASQGCMRFETRGPSLLVAAVVADTAGDSPSVLRHLRACRDLEGAGRRLAEYILPLSLALRACLSAGDETLAWELAASLGDRPLDSCAKRLLRQPSPSERRPGGDRQVSGPPQGCGRPPAYHSSGDGRSCARRHCGRRAVQRPRMLQLSRRSRSSQRSEPAGGPRGGPAPGAQSVRALSSSKAKLR